MKLPQGATLSRLNTKLDPRGSFTEIFRDEWRLGIEPCQWNLSGSRPNVLRGVHLHLKHNDYVIVLQGKISIGLYDLRPKSPTYRMSSLLELSGDRLSYLTVPIGVLHGFYSHADTIHMYGVDSYFDPDDELGCYWADPGLAIAWPCSNPILSDRDRNAPSLAKLEARLAAARVEYASLGV